MANAKLAHVGYPKMLEIQLRFSTKLLYVTLKSQKVPFH